MNAITDFRTAGGGAINDTNAAEYLKLTKSNGNPPAITEIMSAYAEGLNEAFAAEGALTDKDGAPLHIALSAEGDFELRTQTDERVTYYTSQGNNKSDTAQRSNIGAEDGTAIFTVDARALVITLMLELLSKVNSQQIAKLPQTINIQQMAFTSFCEGIKSFISEIQKNLQETYKANDDNYKAGCLSAIGKMISGSVGAAFGGIGKAYAVKDGNGAMPETSSLYNVMNSMNSSGQTSEGALDHFSAADRKDAENTKDKLNTVMQELQSIKEQIEKIADSIKGSTAEIDKVVEEVLSKAQQMMDQVFRIVMVNS